MDQAEYMAEFIRLSTLGRRNWEARRRLRERVTQPESAETFARIQFTDEALAEWDRLDAEEDLLLKKQEYLVRHWPEMPSPAADAD